MFVEFLCDFIQTALLIVAASLLALVLVLTEFSFIKRVPSLGLCIIGVVKVRFFPLRRLSFRVPPVLLSSAVRVGIGADGSRCGRCGWM